MAAETQTPKPQKNQSALIKKFAKFLALACQDLNPNHPGYQKFKFYQRCIENIGGVCYGFSVLHAMMHTPENIARGMPEWLDAAKEAIASWDGKPESLNQLILLPNAERGVKSLREIFEQMINDVIYNLSYNMDLDLRHPVLMHLSQSRPEWHVDLLVPPEKSYLTESADTTDTGSDTQSESKLKVGRVFKIKETFIGGHFSDEDLLLNLDDEETKRLSVRAPLLIGGDGHSCSLRFDEKRKGWFLHDSNYNSNAPNVYRQEVFFPTTSALVAEIKKILGANLKIRVWELIPPNLPPSDSKKESKIFANFNKKFAEDPTPFLLDGGMYRILFQRQLYQTHRKKILEIIANEEKFPNEKINYKDSSGTTLLHMASSLNDTELVDILLARGVDKSLSDHYGGTAFTSAVSNNNPKYAELLLFEGVINKPDKDGNTPIMWAVYNRAKEMQAWLIAKDADIDIPNKNGFTPLMSAAAVNDVESMKILLDAKANVDHKNKDGQTALMQAVIHQDSLRTSDHKAMQKAVGMLIEAGADLTLTDNNGHTALELAAIHGHFDVCEMILSAATSKAKEEESAEDLIADGKEKIPIQAFKELIFRYAAAQNNHPLVEQCLAEGVNFHATGNSGLTAFDSAAFRGHFDMCYKLFTFKKAAEEKSSSGTTVEESKEKRSEEQELIAKKILHEEFLQYLSERMGTEESLWLAVAKHQGKKPLKWLLDNSANIAITEQNEQGETALILAAAKGDAEMVAFLLEKSKDKARDKVKEESKGKVDLINLETVQGETALTVSARKGRMDIVQRLVDQGADLSGASGAKALVIAIERHDLPLLHYLLTHGAQNLPTNGKSTPLHIASQISSASARLILDCSRPLKNLDGIDSYGLTALNHAAIRGDDDLVMRLKENGADSRVGLPDSKFSKTSAESKEASPTSLKLALAKKEYGLCRFFLDKDGGIVSKKNPKTDHEDEKKLSTKKIVSVEPQISFVPPLLDEILNETSSFFKEINKILDHKSKFPENKKRLPDIFKKLDENNQILTELFTLRPELAAQVDENERTPAEYLLKILRSTHEKMGRIFPDGVFETDAKEAVAQMSRRLEMFAGTLVKIDRAMPTIDVEEIPVDSVFLKKLKRDLVHGEGVNVVFTLFAKNFEVREFKKNQIRKEYGLLVRSSTSPEHDADSCEI